MPNVNTSLPNFAVIEFIQQKYVDFLAENSDFYVRATGVDGSGDFFEKDFKVDDLNVVLEEEANDIIEEKDTFSLVKPLCVIYASERKLNKLGNFVGTEIGEFQLIVNTKPQGLMYLEGYTQLLKFMCNPDKRQDIWRKYGLAPRLIETSTDVDGGELHRKLKGRLKMRSVVVTFDKILIGA